MYFVRDRYVFVCLLISDNSYYEEMSSFGRKPVKGWRPNKYKQIGQLTTTRKLTLTSKNFLQFTIVINETH